MYLQNYACTKSIHICLSYNSFVSSFVLMSVTHLTFKRFAIDYKQAQNIRFMFSFYSGKEMRYDHPTNSRNVKRFTLNGLCRP